MIDWPLHPIRRARRCWPIWAHRGRRARMIRRRRSRSSRPIGSPRVSCPTGPQRSRCSSRSCWPRHGGRRPLSSVVPRVRPATMWPDIRPWTVTAGSAAVRTLGSPTVSRRRLTAGRIRLERLSKPGRTVHPRQDGQVGPQAVTRGSGRRRPHWAAGGDPGRAQPISPPSEPSGPRSLPGPSSPRTASPRPRACRGARRVAGGPPRRPRRGRSARRSASA